MDNRGRIQPVMQADPSKHAPSGLNTKRIIYIAVALIGGGLLAYYFYTRMNQKKDDSHVEPAPVITKEAVVSTPPASLMSSPGGSAASSAGTPTSMAPPMGFAPSAPLHNAFGQDRGTGIASRMANLHLPSKKT